MDNTDLAYKAIFNNSPDAIFIIEFSNGKIGKFIDANRAACRSLGYSKKELLQLTPDKISFNVSSNKEPSFSREAFEELVSKKVYVFETVHVKKNGKKFPVRLSAVIVKRDGHPVIAATARDISKFKENEERLKKAEQTYKDILEKTFDGIYKTKLRKPVSINESIEKQVKAIFNNSVIIECNKAFAKMYGYKSLIKIIEKPVKSLYGGKLNTTNYESFVNFVKNGYSLQKTITEEKDLKGNFKFFSNNAVGIIENGLLVGTWGTQSDITESIQKTNELKLREEKYRTIFNSINEGLFIHDRYTGAIVDANQKSCEMYGYSFEEIVKIPVSQLSKNKTPFTQKEAINYIKMAQRKPQFFEWHARKKDGSLFWIEVNMRLGEVSNIKRIIVTFRDINKRKNAEEELKISEIRYRQLVHGLQDPIIVHSLGKFVFVNDAAVKLAKGKKYSDLIGKNVIDFVHHDYREFAIKRMINSGNVLPLAEEKFLALDGTVIDIEVSGSRFLFKGKPATQLIIRDITEQKRKEKIQAALYKISQASVNAVDLMHFFEEIHMIIKSLMPADNLYIALHDKKNEMLTFPYFVDEFDEVVPEGTAVGNGFTAFVLRTGKSLIIDRKKEAELLKKGKIEIVGAASKIWIGIILKYQKEIIGVLALQDYHNESVYGENEKQILTFVSEQIAQAIVKIRADQKSKKYLMDLETAKNEIEYAAKQLSEVNSELKLSEEKLKETNANKDKFFSILSHDLRSPFTALLGYAQLLEEAFDTLSEEEKKLSISSLHKTARNIFELLTGLLEWSRTQTDRMEFEPEKLKLNKITAETISILDMNAAAKKIKLINRLNSRSFAVADRNMVRTIIRNLLSNAIKFTKENGKIEITGKTVKNFMQITVADTGVGMRKDDIDMLFKIEEHHTTLGTNHEVGTGVGLILCKELVEKNGGKIWVESKIGEGSKFIFTLRKN